MENTLEEKIAHLLRRAAFGGSHEDIAHFCKMGLDGAVRHLVDYKSIPDTLEGLPSVYDTDFRVQQARDWWLGRMIFTRRPLEEKMTLFWSNHFATGASKVRYVPYLVQQNNFLRKNALGNFRDIVKGIARDPAMVVWLDNYRNRKASPNENFARELMELFTLGIGSYTERDIKEAARAFTGWFASPQGGGFQFLRRQHDFGEKTFFGRTGAFGGDDIIDILLEQKQCADHVAGKLVRFLLTDTPTESQIRHYGSLLREKDYEIRPVVEAILTSEEFYHPRNRFIKVKSPVEFAVGAVRMVSRPITRQELPQVTQVLSYYLRQMGQELFNPPSVKGWDGGQAWITTNAMLARANLAAVLAGARGRATGGRGQPRPLADLDYILSDPSDAPAGIIGQMSASLGGLQPLDNTRQLLTQYLSQKPEEASRRLSTLQMLMASPEFQLC